MSNDPAVHFLLVEDDEIAVRAIKMAFAKQNVTNPIHVAADGVEALQMLRGEGGRPALPRPYLILLDLNMPRMSGHQFLQEIRSDPDLCESIVFVLTTSDDDRDKQAAYEHNIAGYLVKSRAGGDFLDTVRLLDQFQLTVHFPPDSAARR